MASIVKRQPKGCPQPVYYYHETYRVYGDDPTRKSKVKSRDIYLGTATQVLEKTRQAQQPQIVEVKEFGLVLAALGEAERVGLVDVIDRVVPKRRQGCSVGQYILIAALNKIASPTSRNGIRDWLAETVLPERMGVDPDLFTSQNFWDHFDLILCENELKKRKEQWAQGEITEDQLFSENVIAQIEQGIWENLLDREQVLLDTVFYDTTNFYSFLDAATPSYLARTGHNKHGRHNLRQVGLGLAVTQDGSLPLMHLLYHGRKADAKLFPGSMTDLVDRYLQLTGSTKGLTVVFDKGNNSENNVQHAQSLGITAVGSLVPSHHRDLTGVRLARYEKKVDGKPVFTTRKNVFGLEMQIVVVYNEATYRRKVRRLREAVDQLRSKVRARFEEVKERSKSEIETELEKVLRDSSFRRFLQVEVTGRRYKRLICRIHLVNYRAKLRTFGKMIIFSTDLEMSTEDIVRLYTDKNEVENQFRQINDANAIAFRPCYHWTDTKIKVYALICVLALLLLQLMNYRVRRAGLHMSNAVLRAELADIREVVMIYSLAQVTKQITGLTSVQQQLFAIFDLQRFLSNSTVAALPLHQTS
ncbi:MAG: IS1634 family transposase [Limnochordia bacterium]|jgi:transposase